MHPEDGMNSQDDIQQALQQAQTMGGDAGPTTEPGMTPTDTLVESKNCPVLGMRYAMYKSGLMAEKYPWQTVMALMVATSCGWLCGYFGMTVLGALVVYAVYADE